MLNKLKFLDAALEKNRFKIYTKYTELLPDLVAEAEEEFIEKFDGPYLLHCYESLKYVDMCVWKKVELENGTSFEERSEDPKSEAYLPCFDCDGKNKTCDNYMGD